ncbi:MAG: ABC transporter permease [Chloroflexaceae bacterium]|jgi:peptide/nickel transport system permease protein|nr:ABC transporter permease [Chloroflexaceae bacterium]
MASIPGISTTPAAARPARWHVNRRQRTLATIAGCLLFFAAVLLGSRLIGEAGLSTALANRNQPPNLSHLFGTDWLGRDMLTRTLHGLSLSLWVGLLAAAVSAVIGATLGLLAATLGGWLDTAITWVIDVFFSLPHLVLLIMIAFAVGGGTAGVIIAVALTHWTGLARIIRAEVLQLKSAPYVQIGAKMGRSRLWIARHHMLPHLTPQFLVGLILLFPHAILHEAGLTFIGIGLSPHQPAIGVILAEAMRHITTGYWWLAVLPGLALLGTVLTFDVLGNHVRVLLDPKTSQE